MKPLRIQFTLKEPVLLAGMNTDQNTSSTFNHITGSVIRGAAISRYMNELNRPVNPADADCRRLFFDAQTCYLNAYPLFGQSRTLPVPLSWKTTKYPKSDAYDIAYEDPGDSQLKPITKPFCHYDGNGSTYLVLPVIETNIHTARTRHFGRAMAQDKLNSILKGKTGDSYNPGAIFRYIALTPDQTFESVIFCQDDDESLIKKLLTGYLFIGRSHSAGYGLVHGKLMNTPKNWTETGQDTLEIEDTITLTLLSNVILRDDTGNTSVCGSTMEHVIQRMVHPELKLQKSIFTGELTGGFNRKWGLPLNQESAFKMGSVFKFTMEHVSRDAKTDVLKKLGELIQSGIGERRSEGFGRLAVNWHGETEEISIEDDPKISAGIIQPMEKNSKNGQIILFIQERIFRLKAMEAVTAKALMHTWDVKLSENMIKSSQISNLKSLIQDCLAMLGKEPDPWDRISKFINNIHNREVSRKQFDKFKIGSVAFLEWVKTLFKNNTYILDEIEFKQNAVPDIGQTRWIPSDVFLAELRLRLIHEVLALIVKKMKKTAENKKGGQPS